MPCFFLKDGEGPQRHACRLLTGYFLATLAPFVVFVVIASTGKSGSPTHNIVLVVFTFLWVFVAAWSRYVRRPNPDQCCRMCPAWAQPCGEWPEFCQLAAPFMLVLCVCFFISVVAGDAVVTFGPQGCCPCP